MTKHLIVLVFTLVFIFNGFASYSVYFFTGSVEVVLKDKPSYVLTAINELIREGDALKIAENSEVILKDSSGRFAIIHAAGLYNTGRISDEFKKQQGKSLVSSLAGFLESEITKSNVDVRKMAESYMKQKGGVTRGGNSYPLMVWPAFGSVNESNRVKFSWNPAAKVDSYQVIIFGGEDANNPVEIARTVTPDTFLDVNFKDFGISTDAYFNWVAYPKGDSNHSRFTFKIITPNELKKMLDEVLRDSEDAPNPQDKLLLQASSLEKRGLIERADATFKELTTKYNTNSNKDLYLLFKIRNNLVK